MSEPSFVILYVKNATESAAFYARLLGKQPVDAAPTFAMFALQSGVMLGLWTASGVQPAASAPGGSELAFTEGSVEAVNQAHAQWKAQGIPIAQAPTAMDFGYTFVALDPDGHRLRVFAPGAA